MGVRLHPPRVRHQLHRDPARAGARQLPYPPPVLQRPPVLGGGAAAGVQAVPPDPEVESSARSAVALLLLLGSPCEVAQLSLCKQTHSQTPQNQNKKPKKPHTTETCLAANVSRGRLLLSVNTWSSRRAPRRMPSSWHQGSMPHEPRA